MVDVFVYMCVIFVNLSYSMFMFYTLKNISLKRCVDESAVTHSEAHWHLYM